jgi:hypothetical protein
LNSDILGYYVYFGKDQEADPVKQGTFQTNRNITIEQLPKPSSKQTYYLKIVVKKNNGELYSKQGKFVYLLTT